MSHITPDVLCGFQTLGVKAFGVHLKAAMVMVALVDGALQILVVGLHLAQVLAQQVTPFGSQTVARKLIDFYPGSFVTT